MKRILLLCLLVPSILFSQRADVLVKTDIFTVNYSEIYQQPLRIEYIVQCPNGGASRKGMDFYPNDSIITSDNADYENNIYDKGHLALVSKLRPPGPVFEQGNLETPRVL